MSKAGEMFDAYLAHQALESEMEDALESAFGLDMGAMNCPVKWFSFDYYDNSFELKKVALDWKPTDEQMARAWALGFSRCWVCYEDSTQEKKHELYFGAPSVQRIFPGEPDTRSASVAPSEGTANAE